MAHNTGYPKARPHEFLSSLEIRVLIQEENWAFYRQLERLGELEAFIRQQSDQLSDLLTRLKRVNRAQKA